MNSYFQFLFLVILAILTSSWGYYGFHVISFIAGRHMTKQAKESGEILLGIGYDYLPGLMPDFYHKFYEDPQADSMRVIHDLKVPPGLGFKAFRHYVKHIKEANMYSILLKSIKILSVPDTTWVKKIEFEPQNKKEKKESLRLIIDLVADLHQPMHISSMDDNGKKFPVYFNSIKTNLYSLWENRLIDHQDGNLNGLAEAYNNAITPDSIRRWQQDDILTWMFESYQLSERLKANAVNNTAITEDYYKAQLPVLQLRLQQAGIRLAGLLNCIFEKAPLKGSVYITTYDMYKRIDTINIKDANKDFGKPVTVCGEIYGHEEIGNVTRVYLGAAYPNQQFTVLLKDRAKDLADNSDHKHVCVTGRIQNIMGKPEIVESTEFKVY